MGTYDPEIHTWSIFLDNALTYQVS